jgi:alpha,alpha-trehalose phosphorylase
MGGTWMVLAYGFGGLRDYDGTLSFRPRWAPEPQSSLRFPLTYRGQILDVELTPDSATYSLREGTGLVIWHEGEPIALDRANSSVVRPTLKPVTLSG